MTLCINGENFLKIGESKLEAFPFYCNLFLIINFDIYIS